MTLTELKLFDDSGLITLAPDGWAPGGVTGVDKVVTRLLYALLTPTGSVPGRPNDGSPLAQLLVGFNSDFDIHAAFLTALPSAVATVRAAEVDETEDSEKYGGCRLDGVDIAPDGLVLYLSVAALDGSKPAAPVSVVIPT